MIELAETIEGAVRVLTVEGRLDNATAAEFERRLEATATERVILDLSGLNYISSAGLRGLLSALKRSSAAGGRLAVAAPSAPVLEVLEISGFKSLLPVHADPRAAMAAIA